MYHKSSQGRMSNNKGNIYICPLQSQSENKEAKNARDKCLGTSAGRSSNRGLGTAGASRRRRVSRARSSALRSTLLQDSKLIANNTTVTVDKVPRKSSFVMNSQLGETKVCLIKEHGHVETRLAIENAMALKVTRSSVDEMNH
jgi:translation initiation factor 6 (eIF-6)